MGSRLPHLVKEEGRPIDLMLRPKERKLYRRLYYRGQLEVNLGGEWKVGPNEPLWLITNLDPQRALELYAGHLYPPHRARSARGRGRGR